MTFDPASFQQSKSDLRRDLAARPIGEKLRLLDALRERELAIRGSDAHSPESTLILHEEPFVYGRRTLPPAAP